MPHPRLHLVQGDITKLAVDAIVNAANTSLLGGGGVDGAIHRSAGPELLEECRAVRARQGKCATGQAVITGAGKLPARYVIHAVGPVWNGGNSNADELLASAYRNSLQLAVTHEVRSIAFPNISTGIYGFPKERAAEIALREVAAFFKERSPELDVTFVCFDEENHRIYARLFQEGPAD
jgi:O-acetyl-ADP-ribose deacetylase (regulator of RNase III)